MEKKNSKSYKDNSSRVFTINGKYFRSVDKNYYSEYNHLMESGLYDVLVKKNLMIRHKRISFSDKYINELLIFPEQVDFKIYPYELTFSQWKILILNYIEINLIALKYGMILKDADPNNFYFSDNNFKLIDTTSFIFYDEHMRWNSYYIFCKQLLAPFSLIYFSSPYWIRLIMADKEMFSLRFVSKVLPIKTYLSPIILIHLHFHSFFENKISFKENGKLPVSLKKTEALLSYFKIFISNKKLRTKKFWANYYSNNITITYLELKKSIINKVFQNIKIYSVLDIGANTGEFSFILSKYAKKVYCFENDHDSLEVLFNNLQEKKIKNIYPVFTDLSQLSPSVGMGLNEYDSLIDRIKVDCVLALAIIHHLCIRNYFSFKQVFDLFDSFSSKIIVLEFVDREDEMVKILIGERNNEFTYYNKKEFIKEAYERYEILNSFELNETRTIFHLSRME